MAGGCSAAREALNSEAYLFGRGNMKGDDEFSFGRVALDQPTAANIQKGILQYTYRGLPMLKCPFDLALYMQVIWDLKPRTILEFGSRAGGSALWIADVLTNFGLKETLLRSYDIEPVISLKDPRIAFLKVDVSLPQDFIDETELDALPRPMLIIDDASHRYSDVLTLLKFLHPHIRRGDYIIVEDGIIDRLGLAGFDGGPLQAIRQFLDAYDGLYKVDRTRCDTFGKNTTWNVEGYIQRIA
jgi:cephalosporin hydroxylase